MRPITIACKKFMWYTCSAAMSMGSSPCGSQIGAGAG
jgi:hypothetical protein